MSEVIEADDKTSKPETVALGTRIDVELSRKLRLHAARRMKTMSAIVIELIKDLVANEPG